MALDLELKEMSTLNGLSERVLKSEPKEPGDSNERYTDSVRSRLLGRVFTYRGVMHFVIDVDPATGLVRLSRRDETNGAEVFLMPVAEVLMRLGGNLD